MHYGSVNYSAVKLTRTVHVHLTTIAALKPNLMPKNLALGETLNFSMCAFINTNTKKAKMKKRKKEKNLEKKLSGLWGGEEKNLEN